MPEGWVDNDTDDEGGDPIDEEDNDDDDCAQVSDIFRSRVEDLGDNPQVK